jgi:hypothetical protein
MSPSASRTPGEFAGGCIVERVESRNIDLKMAQLIATAVALSFGVGITMGTMFVAFAALFGA